ncbi:uncharacterized protein METZ01_LOCUS111289 [marine metagenome]|uniref:Uncharacterized protein n=1 Tax=marine metagenome TaxID=408172 RepID=A0A381X130_9ZZZZ
MGQRDQIAQPDLPASGFERVTEDRDQQ